MGNYNDFLVEDILPAREVNLLAGPSGSGKTTLMIQAFPEFLRGGKFLGKKILAPVQVFYLSCDRSEASFKRSLDAHELSHDSFPWGVDEKIPRGSGGTRLFEIFHWVHEICPDVRLLVIDGFLTLLPEGNPNNNVAVAEFLRLARKLCQKFDLTLLGIVHTPKMREGEDYANPRQRISGGVSWAAFSDLVILVEPEDSRDPENPNRVISVLPRQSAEYQFTLRNVEGKLVDIEAETNLANLETSVENSPEGTIFTTSDLATLAGAASRATLFRWIAQATALGLLVKSGRGRYSRAPGGSLLPA